MRGTNRPHGTCGAVAAGLRAGSTASSSGVMPECSFGSSRKYHNQTNTQMRLSEPRMTNEPRHV